MPQPEPIAAAAEFEALRPRLVRIAYRMLGSLAEAEDVVQDAWLRWHRTDRAAVQDAAAFLRRTVARLCLDQLKSARARREVYPGPWLPEPVLRPEEEPPEDERAEDLTLHLMMALERLSPLERAAFLLHDVFAAPFDEVARVIEREPAACRQLAARARAHIRDARPRFPVSEAAARTIADAFHRAARDGDTAALQGVLAADVVFYADGGGKRRAARNPIFGWERTARFYAGLARKPGAETARLLHVGWIDGLPGFVTLDPQGNLQTTALAIEDGRVTAIYVVRNPDKLAHIGRTVAHIT